MNIEIITIGDELLIGQVVDTNSAWISSKMSNAGFDVTYITSIKDREEAIYNAVEDGFERADILLLTGGNGPTKDDITKNTLCNFFNEELVFDNEVLKNIEAQFKEKKIELNELTRNQAYVPQKSTVIQNRVGTAPILWFEKDGKILISMPGVPFEMRWAMNEEIIPRLTKRFQTKRFLKEVFYTHGISESGLAIHLNNFEEQLPSGFGLAYLPGGGVIRLRLSVKGDEHATKEFAWRLPSSRIRRSTSTDTWQRIKRQRHDYISCRKLLRRLYCSPAHQYCWLISIFFRRCGELLQ